MIWFTSDFHFNHKNIAGSTLSEWSGGFRNFASLDAMNYTIIRNLNAKVAAADTLYFLGDFAFGNKQEIPLLRHSINCHNIIVLLGNHDDILAKNYAACFSEIHSYLEIRLSKRRLLVLCHYPIASWRDMNRGSYQLHGHCHGNYTAGHGRQIDVGVDCWDFQPINLDEVLAHQKNNSVVDHHGN